MDEQPDSEAIRTGFSWDELLLLFAIGAGLGGFVFCGILHSILSPPARPVVPDPALGYIHIFQVKHGVVYGTYLEYLAVTYGVFAMWGAGAFCALCLKAKLGSRPYPRHPWQVFTALAISIVLYYAIWRLSGYAARS
jgi:hypothetical protein